MGHIHPKALKTIAASIFPDKTIKNYPDISKKNELLKTDILDCGIYKK
jgi:hypothetical protein